MELIIQFVLSKLKIKLTRKRKVTLKQYLGRRKKEEQQLVSKKHLIRKKKCQKVKDTEKAESQET